MGPNYYFWFSEKQFLQSHDNTYNRVLCTNGLWCKYTEVTCRDKPLGDWDDYKLLTILGDHEYKTHVRHNTPYDDFDYNEISSNTGTKGPNKEEA